MEVAGGRATNGIIPIIDVQPTELHQRMPMFIGSKNMMDELDTYLAKHAS
jgi:fructose-1,6-bisphosphatase I